MDLRASSCVSYLKGKEETMRKLGKLSSAVILSSLLCLTVFCTGAFAESAGYRATSAVAQGVMMHAEQKVNASIQNQGVIRSNSWGRGGWSRHGRGFRSGRSGRFGRADRFVRVTSSVRVTRVIRVVRTKITRVVRTLRVTRMFRQTRFRRSSCGGGC